MKLLWSSGGDGETPTICAMRNVRIYKMKFSGVTSVVNSELAVLLKYSCLCITAAVNTINTKEEAYDSNLNTSFRFLPILINTHTC